MTDITRILSKPLAFFLMVLIAGMISATALMAGPPLPDEYSIEDEDEIGSLLEEELLNFGEDYVDLIEELEDVLEEFDEFFEEFGQVSIKEYTKALQKLQLALDDRYTAESYEAMMLALDDLLLEFEELETEIEESDSKLRRKRLRNLRSLQDDLEDIREQLDDEVGDARLSYKLDAEALSEIITRAFKEARKAMAEAQKVFEEKRLSEIPPIPPVPDIPDVRGLAKLEYIKNLKVGRFDGSLTQSSVVQIDNRDIIIELENAIGGVEAETWNRSEVSAELSIGYREDSRKSRNLAHEIKLVVDHTPKAVKMRVLYPDDESVNIISSRLIISLPRSNPVRINNSFGPVIVEALDNDLIINSSFAAIDVQNIKGHVDVSNTSGAIYLEDIEGGLKASNSFAPIEAVFINGGAILSNSYAPIMIEKSSGRLEINTSGTVSVDHHEGDATIHSSNGEMEIYGVSGNLIAINSFGQMQIENIGGDAEIENANAPIEIIGVDGLLSVSNKFAPIVIERIGKAVSVMASNGNVSIENARASVDVINRFGEVSIQSVDGMVNVLNANAPVTVAEVLSSVTVINQYSPVMVSVITGDVSVENTNASVDLLDIKGATTVNTTFGLVSGENLGGPFIIGNDNGSVELVRVLRIDDDCEIRTTFGDIILELPETGSYNLHATTSYGEIDTDIPMKMTSSGSISTGEYIAGKSNPTIKLTGNNSSIIITTD